MTPLAEDEKTLEQEIAEAVEEHTERDEKGRFVAKDAEPEPEPVAEEVIAGPALGEEDEKADNGPEKADNELLASEQGIPDKLALAPNYAKKAIRENWDKLPTEVRQELHERESEFHKQLTRFDEDRNFGKQVKQVVAPYEPFIRSLGADPVQAVDYLIKTDYALRQAPPEQRKAMFLQAAKDYGISLEDVDLQQHGQQGYDPRVETLAQQVSRLEQERQSDIQAQQLREQQSLEQQIEEFAARPDRPFFDRVSPVMAALLQSGQATDLDDAYDRAVHADPETRALQLKASQQAEQSQRSQQSIAAAQKAKAASASVTGAPGQAIAASSPNSSGSLEDDIRAAMAAASGRI